MRLGGKYLSLKRLSNTGLFRLKWRELDGRLETGGVLIQARGWLETWRLILRNAS